MASTTMKTVGLLALVVFAICLIFHEKLTIKNQADLLADVVREKREIQQRLFDDNDKMSVRQKRSPKETESEDQNVVVLPDNPFPEVDKLMENKSANHYLVPGWTSVHPVGVPATVHTQVFQPGGIVPGVHPVFGQPHGFVATTDYHGESRRDRLKRILKKLLSERVGTVPVAVPVPVVPAIAGDPLPENSFEGSYVAVAGRPGERTVHIVNGRTGVEIAGTVTGVGRVNTRRRRPFIKVDNNENFDYSPVDYNGDNNDYGDYGYDYNDDAGLAGRRDPLAGDGSARPGFLGRGRTRRGPPVPRCSYINTDFFGDDVGDGKGLTASSALECKSTCQRSDFCQFWTYRPGWARGCYLKRGRRGDPTPTNAIPKEGYISGTKLDTCICLSNSVNEEEQVCPVKTTQYVYPWHRKRPNGYDGNVRFDYDDDDIRRRPVDDGLVGGIEPVTLPPPVGIGGTKVLGRKNRARTRAGLVAASTVPFTGEPTPQKSVESVTSTTSTVATTSVVDDESVDKNKEVEFI